MANNHDPRRQPREGRANANCPTPEDKRVNPPHSSSPLPLHPPKKGRAKPLSKEEATTTTRKTGKYQTARRKGQPSLQEGKAKPQPEREGATPTPRRTGQKHSPNKEWPTTTPREGRANPNSEKEGPTPHFGGQKRQPSKQGQPSQKREGEARSQKEEATTATRKTGKDV